MRFTIQLVLEDEHNTEIIEEVIQLDKGCHRDSTVGITLLESKQIMKTLQAKIVSQQAQQHVDNERSCLGCGKTRKLKGYYSLQYRTLFGIINVQSPRLFHCQCDKSKAKTFSPLSEWLIDKNSPELQYLETKWASLVSYQLTATLLQDVLPVGPTQNAATVRNHLLKTAKRQEQELDGKPAYISGCPREWGELPKPDKPMTVGIDGGYLMHWRDKNKNFEIIAGKSFSATQSAKRFGFVQTIDKYSRERLMDLLNNQGMQNNQQITFLSDGADNVRDLQYMMYPESEHVLDWFHIAMRITVLNQFAKGLIKSDPAQGGDVQKHLESIKWYLWHGNVEKALERIEDCYLICIDDEINYENQQKLTKHVEDLQTYIENNCHLIPNYGEKWRYGEAISTGFVESTINEVVAKRMVKKQQMQWTHEGAHLLLQTRTAVLNNELHKHFSRWFPGFKMNDHAKLSAEKVQAAA